MNMDIKQYFSKSFLIISVVMVVIISTAIETDIFIPSFPALVDFFSTTERKIQLLVTVNFLGLSMASLFYGPLADVYGRRPVLLIGMFIFAACSIACALTTNLEMIIIFRFLQGLGAGVAFVVPSTIIHDSFDQKKVTRVIGMYGSVSTFTLAFAPIIGNSLYLTFGWRANFIFIAILATFSFLYTLIFLHETLHKDHRLLMHPPTIISGYKKILASSKALSYLFLSWATSAALIAYIVNLSLIFTDYLGISKQEYGYYQSAVVLVFAIMSFSASKVIERLGIENTRNLGSLIVLIGATLLLCVAIWAGNNPLLITVTMSIYSGGLALCLGIYTVDYLNVFPKIKGIAESLSSSVGLLFITFSLATVGYFFNGTIIPVAIIAFFSATTSFFIVRWNHRSKS